MTGPEAVRAIDKLGLSQRHFALLAGLHPNAIQKWKDGAQPHGPAVVLLHLLTERPELIQVLEARMAKSKKRR